VFGKPRCNPNSKEYKLTANGLILPVTVLSNLFSFKKNEINKRSFLKLSFVNKGLDAINLGNIIHHKSVKYKNPLHFKDQSIRLYHILLQQNTRS
jgi:hypothetical protein